jgi:hypothetical protein
MGGAVNPLAALSPSELVRTVLGHRGSDGYAPPFLVGYPAQGGELC